MSHFYFPLSAYNPLTSDPFFEKVDFSSENKDFVYPVFDVEEFYSVILDRGGGKTFNSDCFGV